LSASPSKCSDKGGTTPGDYLAVTVSYTFKPLFSGVSVAGLLPSPITKTTLIPMK
jgi:hypothetical protein